MLLMPLYFKPDVSSCDQCSTFLMNHSFPKCLAWPALATKTLELMSSWHIHIGSPCLVLQMYSFLSLRNAVDIGLGLQVDRTPIRSNHLKPKGWLWDGRLNPHLDLARRWAGGASSWTCPGAQSCEGYALKIEHLLLEVHCLNGLEDILVSLRQKKADALHDDWQACFAQASSF